MRKWIIVVIFFVDTLSASTQSNLDTIAVEEYSGEIFSKRIITERISILPNKEEVTKQLSWKWECLGPNIQPKEFNPGGRALPDYSVGRGNGTGRINYLHRHRRNESVWWACSPTGGLWQSLDGGEVWSIAGTDVLAISGCSSVASHKRKIDRWWIATGDGDDVFQYSDGVWYTEDGGQTYVSINGHQEGFQLPFGNKEDFSGQISEVESDIRKRDRLYAATNRGLYRAEKADKPNEVIWNKLADGHFYDVQMKKGKGRSRDVIVASGDALWISLNGGKDWEKAPDAPRPGLEKYGFVRITTQLHEHWEDKLMAVITCTELTEQRGQGEALLFFYFWKEKRWELIRSLKKEMNNMIPTRARAIAINPVNDLQILCGNVQPLFYSENGGIQFNRVDRNQMHDDCHHIRFSEDGKTILASHDGGVSRSTDGGRTWKSSDIGIGAANIFGVASSQTVNPSFAFGAYDTGGNVLWDSIWYHVSWGDGFESIVHPEDNRIMFTTMQNGTILRSVDGTSFDTGRNPSGAKTEWHSWIRMHPVYSNMIFCAGEKLMRSVDMGNSWQSIFQVEKMGSNLRNAYRFFLSEDHPGVMYLYVLNDTKIAPEIWRTFNITVEKPEDIVWEKVQGIPREGWIMSIAVDPSDPHRFWLLYGHQEQTGKFWYYDGEQYTDQTENLGRSKCESMVLQRGPEKRLYVGGNYGVFTRRENETQWTLLTGLPGLQIKSMDINYRAGKLVVGTFGRGVWWGDLMKR